MNRHCNIIQQKQLQVQIFYIFNKGLLCYSIFEILANYQLNKNDLKAKPGTLEMRNTYELNTRKNAGVLHQRRDSFSLACWGHP